MITSSRISLLRSGPATVALLCEDVALSATMLRILQRIDASIVLETVREPHMLQSHDDFDLMIIAHDFAHPDILETVRRTAADRRTSLVFLAPDAHPLLQRGFEMGAAECLSLPLREYETQVRLQRLFEARSARYDQLSQTDHRGMLQNSMREIGEDMGISEDDMLTSFDRIARCHDAVTAAHEQRVARYAGLLAHAIDMPANEVARLERAAPLHDIGKVGISAALLNKNGQLTDAERALMSSHSQMGYEILANSAAPLLKSAAVLAGSHHERFDGQGYPQGLRGERIPLEARIVALADVYDALTSARPYKPAWDWEKVSSFIVENRATHFDPQLVDVFLQQRDAFRALQTELSSADS